MCGRFRLDLNRSSRNALTPIPEKGTAALVTTSPVRSFARFRRGRAANRDPELLDVAERFGVRQHVVGQTVTLSGMPHTMIVRYDGRGTRIGSDTASALVEFRKVIEDFLQCRHKRLCTPLQRKIRFRQKGERPISPQSLRICV